jgi:hypothetical protein
MLTILFVHVVQYAKVVTPYHEFFRIMSHVIVIILGFLIGFTGGKNGITLIKKI